MLLKSFYSPSRSNCSYCSKFHSDCDFLEMIVYGWLFFKDCIDSMNSKVWFQATVFKSCLSELMKETNALKGFLSDMPKILKLELVV